MCDVYIARVFQDSVYIVVYVCYVCVYAVCVLLCMNVWPVCGVCVSV